MSEELRRIIKEDIQCQCSKCNATFSYGEVIREQETTYGIKNIKTVCPECKGAFSIVDENTLSYFDKYLNVNNDNRLF